MTDIYTAIMKAADHIERHPKHFDFWENDIPASTDCGSPGCALGWIAAYKGDEKLLSCAAQDLCLRELGVRAGEFYSAMSKLTASYSDWRYSPAICAVGLRLYAAKYHAPAQQPPDWSAMAAAQTIATDALSQDARLLRV